jgi:hypothetical protein
MFNEFYLNAMIKRSENLVLYSGTCSKAEFIMIFLLPKLTGNQTTQKIEKKEWTASRLAFFGPFGEILRLKTLQHPYISSSANYNNTGHSFRAVIPAALSKIQHKAGP